jgi:hypothetical protein
MSAEDANLNRNISSLLFFNLRKSAQSVDIKKFDPQMTQISADEGNRPPKLAVKNKKAPGLTPLKYVSADAIFMRHPAAAGHPWSLS